MNRLLTILLLAAGAAYGQIENPPTIFPLPATFMTNVTVNGILIIASPTVPASPTNSGTAGQVAFTNNYFYICISNNTWRRVQLGTWE